MTTDAIMGPRGRRNRPSTNAPGTDKAWGREMLRQKWRSYVLRLFLGRFDWKGLPDSVDERYLELNLLLEGAAVFFEVDGDMKATKVITETAPDLYGNFPKLSAIGANGWTYSIPENKGVMVWETMSRVPSWPTLELFIDNLVEIEEIKRTNRRQQKVATMLSGPAEAEADMRAIARAMEWGDVVLTTEKFGDADGVVKAISTGVTYLQEEFQSDLQNTLNDLYSFGGIEHMNRDKKAHLLESEASITNDAVARVREDLLFPRQQAAEALNKMFGTKISVEWRNYEKDNMENPSGTPSLKEEK